jgi:hypothetical protein
MFIVEMEADVTASLRLSLQVFADAPASGHDAVLTRQIWRGGATDLATRHMITDPPRWLALADYEGDLPIAAPAGAALLSWDLEQILPGNALSPSRAGGVILVSMDIDPAREDEFNDWYNTEHIPHFSKVAGVIVARRFRALRGAPAYVALYHVEDTDVYATRAWMAANETPWILRMRRFQRNRTYLMFRSCITER